MRSLDEFAGEKLDALERAKLRRTPAVTTRDGIWAERDGRRLLSFSCNDYLNLSQHPKIIAAAIEATQRYGIGAGASRLVTGNHPLYAELEDRLARLKGTEAACVFGSGYLANTGIIPALVGPDDLIVLDELSHACIHAGAKLPAPKIHLYRHADAAACRSSFWPTHRAAKQARAHCDRRRVFHGRRSRAARRTCRISPSASTHGFSPTTPTALACSAVDAARPSRQAAAGADDVPLQMGTLSKAIGAYGGYLCASQHCDRFHAHPRPHLHLFDRPAAARGRRRDRSLDLIETEPAYVAEPLRKARLFTRALNLPEAESAIVPVIVGETEAALAASDLLRDEGFLVVAIRPPTVPAGTARLRFAFTAQHPDAEVERLADIVRHRVLRH